MYLRIFRIISKMLTSFLTKNIVVLYDKSMDCTCGAWCFNYIINDNYRVENHCVDSQDIPCDIRGKTVILLGFNYNEDHLHYIITQSHSCLIITTKQIKFNEFLIGNKLLYNYDNNKTIAQMCWELFVGGNYPWFIRHIINEPFSVYSNNIIRKIINKYDIHSILTYDILMNNEDLQYELTK